MTRFTEADLMPFPTDAVLELPLLAAMCCGCGEDILPFEQARCPGTTTTMQLCHYKCPADGMVWGHYFPIRTDTEKAGLTA